MPHPSYHSRVDAEIEGLKAQIAALTALVAGPIRPQEITDPSKPVELLPPGVFREPGTGLLRGNRNGTPWSPDADTRPYTVRQAEALAEHKTGEKATLAAMKEGLPPNCIRTWDGLVRDERSGKIRGDLSPKTYAPPVTEISPPSPKLLLPHVEEVFAGQSPDAMTDEVAEIMKLRRREIIPTPAVEPATPSEIVADTMQSPERQITDTPDPIQRYPFERPVLTPAEGN